MTGNRPRSARRIALLCFVFLSITLPAVPAAAQLRETVRGGAGEPMVELPEAREENRKAETTYRRLAEGVYVLELFETTSANGSYEIAVWNLLVGPGRASEDFELPGSAVLLVRAGDAVVAVEGDEERRARMGSTLVVPEKTRLRITNGRSERPVLVRATIFRGAD